MTYHLAQINVGELLAPTDDPRVAGFMNALDEINALADDSPGFVWRLQSDEGNATDFRAYEKSDTLVNISVWESIEALHSYTYKTAHTHYIKRRKEWFHLFGKPHMCLWWVPAGHIPTVEEAVGKLEHFTTHGATAEAFSFAKRFDPI